VPVKERRKSMGLSLLFKAISGGIFCLLATWIVVLAFHSWRLSNNIGKTGELGAVAGGWLFLLQSPLVLVILTVAFGVGFCAAVRLISR
jgi:hypothetical protein